MLTITLSLIAVATIVAGTIAYQCSSNNVRQLILGMEILISRNGRVSTTDVMRFRNDKELIDFIEKEQENAQGLPNDPSNLQGLRNIYLVTAPEVLIKEMKTNLVSYRDVEKYKNKPPAGVVFHIIK